jgi:DNA helicase-2/ATP-dependent DNA helicase PcrA
MSIQDQINNTPMSGGIAVTAGAGTGKTYTLVNKIQHCIDSGINPVNMLVFSFTVDAANELKNRIKNGHLITVGTIHSVMYQIIRENSPKRYFVLDNGYQKKFVFDIFKELQIDYLNYNKFLSRIDLAKNMFPEYYDMLEDRDQNLLSFFENNHKLIGFAQEFEAKKEKQHKIVFSDMQLKAYDILRKNPAILDSRQERWKYIFLDEAQDASNVDIAVIMLLAEKYKQLFVVGDVKQKIFSFRTG